MRKLGASLIFGTGPKLTHGARESATRSGKDTRDHVAGNAGEPEIPSAIAIRQPGVIDPEQVQGGCVEVVRMRSLAGHLESEIVTGAINQALFDAHPASTIEKAALL